MELGSIQREIYIDAPPEIVFDVVSRPEHIKQWWPDDARYEPAAGAVGEIYFGGSPVSFTVVEVERPRTFTFRWTHPAAEPAVAGNSLLVTFELVPSGDGTMLSMRETGFREMGWEVAVLERQYQEHLHGWDHFLPRIAPYVASLELRP
jgi:uncharacterized protein YndB with AHSA1/START domain